jgi:ssDNA-binding Zn-finger/Zn-ribbon topoisomerase 1
MSIKKTHQQYEEELFDKEINILPLEEYKGSNVKIAHECIHGHEWLGRPDHILSGVGCPVCYGNVRKSLETYQGQLTARSITALSYVSHRDYAEHQCGKCNFKWSAKPRDILADHGCPNCAKMNHPGGYNKTRFSRDRELANSPGIMYCIVLVDKSTDERACVKLGITKGTSNKDVLKRATGFKGYEPRIQKIVKGTLEQVFNLEQELHTKWQEYRYFDSWKFGGHSELFKIDKLKEILESIPKEL